MDKHDLKVELKHLYQASAKAIVEVDVPTMNFLMIDGAGDPNTSPAYASAVEALFMVSYAAKFIIKKGAMAVDYAVMPLEGLWWADDMSKFSTDDKSNWKWTAMIMQPSFVSQEVIDRAITEVKEKKNPPTHYFRITLRAVYRRPVRSSTAHRAFLRRRTNDCKSVRLH